MVLNFVLPLMAAFAYAKLNTDDLLEEMGRDPQIITKVAVYLYTLSVITTSTYPKFTCKFTHLQTRTDKEQESRPTTENPCHSLKSMSDGWSNVKLVFFSSLCFFFLLQVFRYIA